MGLKRVGVLLFGVGLCLSLFSAVAFGFVAGGTAVFCEDHEPTYSIERVDVASMDVTYSDGCNYKGVNSAVVGGGFLAVVGVLVGSGGVLREWSTVD